MRYCVLVVDDVQENLDILESILERNYDVMTATSGRAALEKMKRGPQPHLVLLDKYMDGMDGFEVLRRMNSDEELVKIPVIFVTAADDIGSEKEGLDLGAVDYLLKPYEPGIIHRRVRNHIELKGLRDDLEIAIHQRTSELEKRTAELAATHDAIIMGMSLLSESRDQETGAHLARIKNLVLVLARRIRKTHPQLLTKEQIELFATYAPLHDVGKVGVPDAVLKKQGKLTDGEFNQMKSHTTSGGELLREIAQFLPDSRKPALDTAIEIAECHHERYDGTGYPRGLAGKAIPFSARIVSVADVYDALRSPRPYKPAFTHMQSMEIMLKGDGRTSPSHFDPVVLDTFRSVHDQLRETYENILDPSQK